MVIYFSYLSVCDQIPNDDVLLIYLHKWNHTNSAKRMKTGKCSRIFQLIQTQRASKYIRTTSGSHHHTEIQVKYITFQKSTFGIAQHWECPRKKDCTLSKTVASLVNLNKKKCPRRKIEISEHWNTWANLLNIEILGQTYRKLSQVKPQYGRPVKSCIIALTCFLVTTGGVLRLMTLNYSPYSDTKTISWYSYSYYSVMSMKF